MSTSNEDTHEHIMEPASDTTSTTPNKDGTNQEAFRKYLAESFASTYIIENDQREAPASSATSATAPATSRPTLKLKHTRAPENERKATAAKKMRSTKKVEVAQSIEKDEPTSRRSDRIRKRPAPEEAAEEIESPLTKKSKKLKKSAMIDKGRGKARAYTSPAPRSRPSGLTSTLRKKGVYPTKHTPSSELATKHIKSEDEDTTSERTDPAREPDQNQAESSKSATEKGKRTGDKKPGPAIPVNFIGTYTGLGTSREKPANAILEKPWSCANRNCASGMTWLPRDSKSLGKGKNSEGFARKNVSQFFGRNKRETHTINVDVWHVYCRKDYQRLYYKAMSLPSAKFGWQMKNVKTQVLRLKLWRPDALFNVQFTKKMHAKATEWHRILRAYGGDEVAAQAEFDTHERWGIKEPMTKKKGNEAMVSAELGFSAKLYDHFNRVWCGNDCNYDRIDDVLQHIEEMYAAGLLLPMLPPIEFLMHDQAEGETVNDPTKNYARWLSICDGDGYIPLDAPEGEGEDYVKAEESDGFEIHVAGADDDDDEDDDEDNDEDDNDEDDNDEDDNDEDDNDEDITRDTLIGAVLDAANDEDDDEGSMDVDVKEEEESDEADSDVEIIETARPASAFTPFIQPPAKKPFKLTATNVGNGRPLSSTYGAAKGSGRADEKPKAPKQQ